MNKLEEEYHGTLAFLDTLLKWNNGKISVLVYRKPTPTGQYVHFSSYHKTLHFLVAMELMTSHIIDDITVFYL